MNPLQEQKIFRVSEINQCISDTLDQNFSSLWIQGEVSNFVAHSSGHWYFSLKEENSQIKAVMFRGNNQKMSFQPKNGSEVLVRGQVSAYIPRGTYQILCHEMEMLGSGLLQQNFEKLKQKLQIEGLFDEERKKQIPTYPKHIGVITSETGAALRDILKILKRRAPGVKVTLIPALVQGEDAPKSLLSALKLAEQIPSLDTLILGRGGGSMEDLFVFNDEKLARAISKSKLPIISAVGHEIDFTICDFVSDLRAATPSAAAELVAKNTEEQLIQLAQRKKQLIQFIFLHMKLFKEQIASLKKQLLSPEKSLQNRIQRLDEMNLALVRSIKQILLREKTNLDNLRQILETLNPKQIMERGFSIVLDKNNKIVTHSKQLKKKDSVSLEFFNGRAEALVTNKE